ncbi:MAG: dUTP diphosphatase [Acholeplasmatales bacterium]|jgi:dUTP pyrophosphatase|nr:dUTP diphosphatase [Acholeplasmatales bacterium]
MRKFEIVSTYLNNNLSLPERMTKNSAGYDIKSSRETIIHPQEIVLVPTGIKASFPKNEVLLIYPRSSIPIKLGLIIPNGVGVIDSDYYNNSNNEGEIFIPFLNITKKDVIIEKDFRIAQAIFTKFYLTDVDEKNKKERTDGFGSSGL